MWQAVPSAVSTNSNPLFRQIQHGTNPVHTVAHPPSSADNPTNPQDRKSAARSVIPDDDAAQIWIDQVKRRRVLKALAINTIIQFILVVIANLRPTIYFWRAISIRSIVYLIVFLLLQQAFLVIFIRHVKVVSRSGPGLYRLLYLLTNPSTLLCYSLSVVSSLWAIMFAQASFTFGLRCFANRLILFSSMYFIRRLITQPSFRFPPMQLPLDCLIRSRALLVCRSSIRYTMLFTVVWYLTPFSLLRFLLQKSPLKLIATFLFPPSDCHFCISSEVCCIMISLMLFASWECSRIVLESVLMQSILTDKSTSVSVSILVKILQQDRDHYTRSLGFLELSDVCNISSESRITIFRSGDQTIWASILKVCLDTLNEFSKSLHVACESVNRRTMPSQIPVYFSRNDDLINITQALSALVVHSIEEDEMGLVQRSFEEIVGALLAASIAVEDFMRACFDNFEISFANKNHLYVDRDGRVDATQAPLALSRAVDRALYRIIFKFYRYLKNFSFPQQYAIRLGQYAEFQ